MTVRIRVIGCGNPEAGDDALGLIVADGLSTRLVDVPTVEVLRVGPAVGVLDLLEGVEAVLIVDAVRDAGGAREPGTVVHIEVGPEGFPVELRSSLSSHGLGVAEAVGLAAALGPTPRVEFWGVEVADVTMGRPLSAPIANALPALGRAVEVRARALAVEVPPG